MTDPRPLDGKTGAAGAVDSRLTLKGPVLLVEDDGDVGDIIASMLAALGYDPVHRAATIGEAFDLLNSAAIEAVVLDALLRGAPAHLVAQHLRDRRIPFVVSTAYDPERLPAAFRAGVALRKPYDAAALMRALAAARSQQS